MTSKMKHWFHGLVSACVTGIATSGLSALGVAGLDEVGMNITKLDLKQMCIITVIGGVVGMLAYLKQSPLEPVLDDESTTTTPPVK